jgi:hypothetical protein
MPRNPDIIHGRVEQRPCGMFPKTIQTPLRLKFFGDSVMN